MVSGRRGEGREAWRQNIGAVNGRDAAVPPTTRGSLRDPLMFSKVDNPVQKQIERTGKVKDISREDKITNNTGKKRNKK
jgi:hypothetical protein